MKTKKIYKLMSFILTFALLFSLVVIDTQAADEVLTMSISNANGIKGNNVILNVTLGANSGMVGGNFIIVYDATKLEVVNVSAGELLTGISSSINTTYLSTKIKVSWAGTEVDNRAGILAAITFKVKDTAASGTANVMLETSTLYGLDPLDPLKTPSIAHQTVAGYINVSGQMRTVNFETNGGSPLITNQQVENGTKAAVPTAVSRTGYTFGGWYALQDFSGGLFDFNTVITKDTTLYARWLGNTSIVTFDSQGGSNVASLTASRGMTISKPAAPAFAGKTFVGWYKDVAFNTPWNFSTDVVSDNITLFAKWDTIQVTGVSLFPSSLNLNPGETKQAAVSYTPSNASNRTVAWSSDKPDVASVDTNGIVTAKGAGSATITATTPGNITGTCNVTVKAKISGAISFSTGGNAYYTEVRLNNGTGDIATTYTDMLGNFTFNAATGAYTIKAITTNDGFADASQGITVAEGDTNKTININLQEVVYQNSSITINLTKDAQNYSGGFNVYISGYQTNFWQNEYAEGSANGTITIPNVPYTTNKNLYSISIYTEDGYWDYKEVTVDAAVENVAFPVPVRYKITGYVHNEASAPVPYVSLIATGTDGRSYWGYTDENGMYSIVGLENGSYTIQMDTWGKYVSDPVSVIITTSDISVGADLIAKVAADLLINVQKSDSTYPYKAYVTLYKKSGLDWQYITSSAVAGENALLEGAIKGFGEYKLQLDSVYNSHWVSQSFVSEPVLFTVGAETDLTEGRVSKVLTYSDPTNPNVIFTGDGNLVLTDVNLVRNGSKANLIVKYKNNGNSAVTADFTAQLPAGVTAGTGNTFSVTNLAKGASGQKSIALDIGSITGSMVSVPVTASIGGTAYDFGTASLEMAGITLNAPGAVKTTDSFKVYGEATEGSTIVIKDLITGKILANAKPNGRWYYAQISNLSEGNYKLVAEMTSGAVTVSSQPVGVEAKASQITITKVKAGTYGSSELPINSKIGVHAFTAWVDSQLNGRDIELETTFEDIGNVIQTVTYHFMGKDYTAVKSNGVYVSTLSGWSGTGLKNITATVTTSDNRTLTFIIAEVTILIDPSGYVTDIETGERLSGVTVICEVWNSTDNKWETWNAELYGQVNPQVSDSEGNYGWMVPAGTYRVKTVMAGYLDFDTLSDPNFSSGGNSTIVIPPVRTDVNMALTPAKMVESVTLNKEETTIGEGQKETLDAIVTPNDATNAAKINWTSSNTAIATVDSNGNVTAIKAGTAIITASIGTKTDSCVVKVSYNASITIKKDGAAVPAATTGVTYKLDTDGIIYTATIGEGGQFTISGLSAGYHRIYVSYSGQEISNAVIDGDATAIYNFVTAGSAVIYTVVYKDWDGRFLKAVSVANGDAAVYGADPIRNGYTFEKWVDAVTGADVVLANVTSNLTLLAKYTSPAIGNYTLSRNGYIYDNRGNWFNVDVRRNTVEQINNPLLKVVYDFADGNQIIAVTALVVNNDGNSLANRINIPLGATGVTVRLVNGDAANWPILYKSGTLYLDETTINAGVGN